MYKNVFIYFMIEKRNFFVSYDIINYKDNCELLTNFDLLR